MGQNRHMPDVGWGAGNDGIPAGRCKGQAAPAERGKEFASVQSPIQWGAENAAQDVVDVARRLVLALEARLKQKLDIRLPIVRWLVKHAACVLTRYQVGHDGFTSWRRFTGKTWKGTVAEHGEQVLGKLALKKPSTDRKVKKGKGS